MRLNRRRERGALFVAIMVAIAALVVGPGAAASAATATATMATATATAATMPGSATVFTALTNVSKPTISGAPAVGSVLTANPGTWKGLPPYFFTYYWSSPTTSHLADTRTYTPVAADLGQVLTVHILAQDNSNHHQSAQASTPAITASDVVNTVTPKFSGGIAVGDTATVDTGTFTSGSGALSYSYAWSRSDGSSTTPLPDKGATHLITTADLGYSFSVTVTARSQNQVGFVTAQTRGVVIPAVPFPTDAGLTAANHGTLTGRISGSTAIITDPGGASGNGVFVYGYSAATPLGWYALDDAKSFRVSFAALAVGPHKLVLIDQTGTVVGWLPVTRAADAGSFAAVANSPIALVAVAIVLLGIIVIVVTAVRRRRRAPRH